MKKIHKNTFRAEISGFLNGHSFGLVGGGLQDATDGLVNGRYDYRVRPKNFEPMIFNCLLITGYPSVSKSTGNSRNPFKGKQYHYYRSIEFENGQSLKLETKCDLETVDGVEILNSSFVINGDLNTPILISVEPVVETWIPIGPGRVDGVFPMVWRDEKGNALTGIAKTEYHINDPDFDLENVQHRWIEISSANDDL